MKRALLLLLALLVGVAAGECLVRFVRQRTLTGRLDAAAANEPLPPGAIARELDLLHWPIASRIADNFLGRLSLRRALTANLRERTWLEGQIAPQLLPNEQEERQFYATHPALFHEPLRLRASHLFLAAPEGYPEEVIATKRALIQSLAQRLKNGESFDALVAKFSEDEATKTHGGDLNFFAEERMLPAVWNAARTLHVGATSAPLRSRLGFHILRLTSRLPAQDLTFAQAAPEIAATLEKQRRASAVTAIVAQLGGKIEIAAPRD